MKKIAKIIIGAAAGALAAGAIGWFLYDKYECQGYNFNTAYCTARNAIFGFDKNNIEGIDVDIYFDSRLSSEERRKAKEAFEGARQAYYNEFGINLMPNIEGIIKAPKDTDNIDLVINNDADFSIVYMEEVKNNVRNPEGMSYLNENIIAVDASQDVGCIENTTAHEIGHLFYADHCKDVNEDVLCTMFRIGLCFSPNSWCETDRAVIELYKHRFW
ncbi:MAG: hypothetical protein WC852_02280 [Candidatus Nanoarchaeia archaeon]|jgi:hypothetical protein